jgi:hypothetical protein
MTPTNTTTPTYTPTPSVTPNWVYVYQSCSPILPNVLSTQVVQTVQAPIATIVGQTFKDYDGTCWTYLGQYPTTYIVPPTYIPVTFAGNYFAIYFSTVFNDCLTCQTTPACYEYFVENVSLSSIKFDLANGYVCPSQPNNSGVVSPNDGVCIFSTVALPNSLAFNATWANNSIPGPQLGVDYLIIFNGCP